MRYLLFHKPFDVVSQFSDPDKTGRPTLADFVPVEGVYPVGRLDRDSEGLMLLTDDGPLQFRLSEPRFGHKRTYWAQVEGVVEEEALRLLRQGGLAIQDYRTQPAEVRVLEGPVAVAPRDPPIRYRASIPDSWIELTLTEGKNRQVRRMTAAVGLPTLRLIRVAIGELRLEGLGVGEWRDLTAAEKRGLVSRRSGGS